MILDGVLSVEVQRQRLDYVQARQALIAQNVANADTPGFQAKDLKPFAESFDKALARAQELARTDAEHIARTPGAVSDLREDRRHEGWERAPDGNDVVLEQEMIKASEARAAYELSTLLIAKHADMTRAAFGVRG